LNYNTVKQTLFNQALRLDILECLLENPTMDDGDELSAQKAVISIESGTAQPFDLYHLFQVLLPFAGTSTSSLKKLSIDMLNYRGAAVEVIRAVKSGVFK
jgi:hypothetical protein